MLSNEWSEYHLTPRGWEDGSDKTDFASTTTMRPDPPDRVLTLRYSETQSSMFSAMNRSLDERYRHSDAKLVAELISKFGDRPEHLKGKRFD